MQQRSRIDPSLISICARLSADGHVFVREAAALDEAQYRPWIDTDAYTGAWVVHPFVLAHADGEQVYDVAGNCARCPASAAIFKSLPRVHIASFSRLLPGTRLPPHRDYPKRNVLRIHIGLQGAEHAKLVIDNEVIQLQPGEVLVFDHSLEHESYHVGTQPRDIVLIDYEVDEVEAEHLGRLRGGVNLGPTADSRVPWTSPKSLS